MPNSSLSFKKAPAQSHPTPTLTAQILAFLGRQLALLQHTAQQLPSLHPSIATSQITDTVSLMQQRLLQAGRGVAEEAFHDYLSDFYEDKIDKLKKELNQQLMASEQLKQRYETASTQLHHIKNQQEYGPVPNLNSLLTDNSQGHYKNELLHSQHLIAQNQQVMEEQNILIQNLQAHVTTIEQRQAASRQRCEGKVKQLDALIDKRRASSQESVREYEERYRKLEREGRELELMNVSYLQERGRLEGELELKSEEIKLLSKKVYDQSLLLERMERSVEEGKELLLRQRTERERVDQDRQELRGRLRAEGEQARGRVEWGATQMRQLEARLNILAQSNTRLQETMTSLRREKERLLEEGKVNSQQMRRLERQLQRWVEREQAWGRQERKWTRKQQEWGRLEEELGQTVREKSGQVEKCKEVIIGLQQELRLWRQSQQEQQNSIRKELQVQFQALSQLNQQILTSLQARENQLKSLREEYSELLNVRVELNGQVEKLKSGYDVSKQMVSAAERQLRDSEEARLEMEQRWKHATQQRDRLSGIQAQMEKSQQQIAALKTEIEQKTQQSIDKQRKLAKLTQLSAAAEDGVILSQKQELKLLREEGNRRQFVIRQLNSKANILQGELREAEQAHHNQKEHMKAKISELEELIQERYELTQRISDH